MNNENKFALKKHQNNKDEGFTTSQLIQKNAKDELIEVMTDDQLKA